MVGSNSGTTILIFPRRSDGQQVVRVGAKGKEEDNSPTPEQLDQTPKENGERNFYRLLQADDAKHLDWRRKLARMCQEYGPPGKFPSKLEGPVMLEHFPTGYRLYEHVKMRGSNKPAASSNHAGGGPDVERQDTYLYGHPTGRKKRFRSPADFYPHLIWLMTDESGDSDNCRCKFCSPEDLQSIATLTNSANASSKTISPAVTPKLAKSTTIGPVSTSAATPAASKVTAPTSSGSASKAGKAAEKKASTGSISARKASGLTQSQKTAQRTASTQPEAPSQSPAISNVEPLATPPADYSSQNFSPPADQTPPSSDRNIDLDHTTFFCRVGEVVWYQNQDQRTFSLGAVVGRWLSQDFRGQQRITIPEYSIQPFSSPLSWSAPVPVSGNERLKPWLMLIPPPYYSTTLREHPMNLFQVKVEDFRNGLFGSSNMEIDASLLAAKTTDNVAHAFDKLQEGVSSDQPADPNITQEHQEITTTRHYSGIFFGGEKLYIGDVARFHPIINMDGTTTHIATDLIHITAVVERVRHAASLQPAHRQPNNATFRALTVVGNVYRHISNIPSQNLSQSPMDPNLPHRFRADVHARNAITNQLHGYGSTWIHIETGRAIDVSSLQGRYYELSLALPVYDPDTWAHFTSGRISDADLQTRLSLLNRGDTAAGNGNGSGGNVDAAKKSIWLRDGEWRRQWDWGCAAPPNAILVHGLEGPTSSAPAQVQVPQHQQQQQQQQQYQQQQYQTQHHGQEQQQQQQLHQQQGMYAQFDPQLMDQF